VTEIAVALAAGTLVFVARVASRRSTEPASPRGVSVPSWPGAPTQRRPADEVRVHGHEAVDVACAAAPRLHFAVFPPAAPRGCPARPARWKPPI